MRRFQPEPLWPRPARRSWTVPAQALGIQPPILLGLPDGGMGAETNKVALRESRAEIRIVCNPWRMRYGRFTFSDEAPGSRPLLRPLRYRPAPGGIEYYGSSGSHQTSSGAMRPPFQVSGRSVPEGQ